MALFFHFICFKIPEKMAKRTVYFRVSYPIKDADEITKNGNTNGANVNI